MKVNVAEFLKESGIDEPFYPGKRLVKQCRQAGEFKSHSVVFDWRDPGKIRIEVKAGLSGRSLEPAKLKNYPVCFQSPTYVEIEMVDQINAKAKDDEDDEEAKGKGKSGSGDSKGHKKKKKTSLAEMSTVINQAFSDIVEGKVPELGQIVEMVVMGTEIAKDAYGAVMGKLCEQLQHAKIGATDLLSQAGKFITTYTPPAFMKPSGTEDAVYSYDREKNENIGFRTPVVG